MAKNVDIAKNIFKGIALEYVFVIVVYSIFALSFQRLRVGNSF